MFEGQERRLQALAQAVRAACADSRPERQGLGQRPSKKGSGTPEGRFSAKRGRREPTSVSGKRVSNPRPSAWEADALPTELLPQISAFFFYHKSSTIFDKFKRIGNFTKISP